MQQEKRTQTRRGSETRKKVHLVTSRYDADEYAELEEAASRAGLTRASYQRVQSLGKPKTKSTRRAPIDRQLLSKVLWHLGKVGNNLNQIAHAAHLDPNEKHEIEITLKAVRLLMPLILKALGRPM